MNEFLMDAHMHFDLYKDKIEVLHYIEAVKSYTIAMTNSPDIYNRYEKLVGRYKYTQIAIGYHPELVKDFPNQIELFKKLSVKPRYIGEVGLDGSTNDKRICLDQERIFSEILEFLTGKNKVLSVHSRHASKDVLKHLDGFAGIVIMHWYSGRIQDLEEAIDRGYYFSINPQMLKSKSGANIISKIPVQRILLESDAPFIPSLKSQYSIDFNDIIYEYFANMYNVTKNQVEHRVKANFEEIVKAEDSI